VEIVDINSVSSSSRRFILERCNYKWVMIVRLHGVRMKLSYWMEGVDRTI